MQRQQLAGKFVSQVASQISKICYFLFYSVLYILATLLVLCFTAICICFYCFSNCCKDLAVSLVYLASAALASYTLKLFIKVLASQLEGRHFSFVLFFRMQLAKLRIRKVYCSNMKQPLQLENGEYIAYKALSGEVASQLAEVRLHRQKIFVNAVADFGFWGIFLVKKENI